MVCTNKGVFWYWVKIWFPHRCDTIYTMGWLHLVVFILLAHTFYFSLMTQPHDIMFNKNLEVNDRNFSALMDRILPKKTKDYRMQRALGLVLEWNGMFIKFEPRGEKQPILTGVALAGAIFNLCLLVLAIPVFVKNCSSGLSYEKFHLHDWKVYKGIPGFVLTVIILLMTALLFLAALLSTVEVVQTEMVYEMHFSYCVYQGDYMDKFCFYSKQELGHDEDYCDKIKEAFAKSYLCQHPFKYHALFLVWIAILLHFIIVCGYGQMAYRPRRWEQYVREKFYELHRKKRVAIRAEMLEKAAGDKLKILQKEKELRNIELRKWDLLLYSQKAEYVKKLFSKEGARRRLRLMSLLERRKLSELEKAEKEKREHKTNKISDPTVQDKPGSNKKRPRI